MWRHMKRSTLFDQHLYMEASRRKGHLQKLVKYPKAALDENTGQKTNVDRYETDPD